MRFKLIHISDIHFGPLPKVRKRELIGKRITGFINWRKNRSHFMGDEVLRSLTQAVQDENADHIAITGDLINLGLSIEIENAADWLENSFDPKTTSVVPGNHDAYVVGSLGKALARWKAYVIGDKAVHKKGSHFPYLRIQDGVAIIGLSSAIATPPFVAAGRFDKRQAKKLAEILRETGRQELFRVVLIHHPPVRGAARPLKRLFGIGRFQKTIRKNGAELVLHGHTHLPQRHTIKGLDGAMVPVIGVPSASQSPGAKRPPSAYNLFEIEKHSGKWSCRLTEHALSEEKDAFKATRSTKLL